MIDRAKDAAFQRAIVTRDQSCIYCGENRQEYLCAHHLLTRGLKQVRHDLRNGVTVCNNPRLRYVPGLGMCSAPCHELVETHREWANDRAGRLFIREHYFTTMDEFERFQGAAKGGQPLPGGPMLAKGCDDAEKEGKV